MNEIQLKRQWMKADFHKWGDVKSDQAQRFPQPPLEKGLPEGVEGIQLPPVDFSVVTKGNLVEVIRDRISHRQYSEEPLSLKELSFLLWATQGVKEVTANNYATKRTVPSGGARHPFETYLAIQRVTGLKPGIYYYSALNHQLGLLFTPENQGELLGTLSNGQKFVGTSAVTFIWSCIPYRSEWRYHISAHKTMLLDAGHLCQNLYLAAEAIGCGTCAIGSYHQEEFDRFMGFDGDQEFVVYVAPVGKQL